MAFSVEDLILQFRIQIADTETPYLWSDDQIAVLFNEGEREFAVATEIFKGSVDIVTNPHEMPYVDIPTGLIRPRRAKMSTGTKALDIVNFNELDLTLTNENDYGSELINNWETTEGEPRLIVMDEVTDKARLIPRVVDLDVDVEEVTDPWIGTSLGAWVDGATGTSSATVLASELILNRNGGADDCFVDLQLTVEIEASHTLTVDKRLNDSQVSMGTTQGATDIYAGLDDALDVDVDFTPTVTTLWIRIDNPSGNLQSAYVTSVSVKHHAFVQQHPTLTLHYIRFPTNTITASSINTELTDTRHQQALVTYARARAYSDQDSDTYDPQQAVFYMGKFDSDVLKFKSELTRKTRRAGTVKYGGL